MVIPFDPLGMFRSAFIQVCGETSGNGTNKKPGSGKRFLLPCFIALTFCLLPDAASAEGRCPPGMFETVSRDFLACAPIPGYGESSQERGDEPSRPQLPPVEIQPSYMAAARDVDTGSLWVSVGHRTLDSAKLHVLKACNAATRGGCYVSDTHFGVGKLYVAEDAMGQLWTKIQPYDKVPPRFSAVDWNAAIEHCWKNSFGCGYAGSFQSGLLPLNDHPDKEYYEDRFPKGKMRLKRWALVATPTQSDTTAGQNKSWLISGKEDSVAARKEVLDRCQTESAVLCSIAAYAVNTDDMVAFSGGPKSVNGLLVHFVDARGRNRWTSAVSDNAEYQKKTNKKKAYIRPMTVRQRIDQLCPPQFPCRLIATYDAATPRMQIVEDSK